MSTAIDTETKKALIEQLGTAPDSILDAQGTKMCREFDHENGDIVRFARDLLDLCVRYSWSGRLAMEMLRIVIDNALETPEEARTRREELLKKWEPGTPLSQAG
jgi:hypothetical protein